MTKLEKNVRGIYARTFQNPDLSNRSDVIIPALYSVVNINPNQAFWVAIAVLLLQIMNYVLRSQIGFAGKKYP